MIWEQRGRHSLILECVSLHTFSIVLQSLPMLFRVLSLVLRQPSYCLYETLGVDNETKKGKISWACFDIYALQPGLINKWHRFITKMKTRVQPVCINGNDKWIQPIVFCEAVTYLSPNTNLSRIRSHSYHDFCERGKAYSVKFYWYWDKISHQQVELSYSDIITVTSWWAQLRLKSPASRLFTQLVQAQNKENIKAPRHWFISGRLYSNY